MLKTSLAACLFMAWLFPARPIAQSGTVAYTLLDIVDSSYLWNQGNLKPRFPYWNGFGTSVGARMRLETMVRHSGGLRFCVSANHSYGDYGWTDFNECGEPTVVPARQPFFLPPDSLRMTWGGEASSELLFRTANGDSLRFQREDRGDTLVISWWWFWLNPTSGKGHHLVTAGRYDREVARSLMRYLIHTHRMDTAGAQERHSVLRVVQRFVPEGTVALEPEKRITVPVPGKTGWDALGRRQVPRGKGRRGQPLSSPFTTPGSQP